MNYDIILLILFHTTFAYKNYTGFTLLRCISYTQKQVEFLKTVSQVMKIDYWRYPVTIQKPVDMLVAPEDKKRLMSFLEENGYNVTTIMDDVQRAFDNQTIKSYIRRQMSSFDFKHFFPLYDIYNWLKDLSIGRPNEVQIIKLGETFENRDILAVKINLTGSTKRSTVVIEGGIHAREWITPAFVCYLIHNIVYLDESDSEMKKIANLYEWYIVPVLNPDGYVYSFQQDRLWRKNRRSGYGVDLNRNFDSAWGSVGVKKDTWQATYCGSHAFSEKETIAMKNLVEKISDHLEYYLGFHSYGQQIILPYAYSSNHTDNYEEMTNILNEVKKSISKRFGTNYVSGTVHEVGGFLTSGISTDWVKAKYRVPYVAMFELRDSGWYGFALPPQMILPTCQETLDGLKVLLTPITKYEKLESTAVLSNSQSRYFISFLTGLFTFIVFCSDL